MMILLLRRLTIMIDEDLLKKLRIKQAKMIMKTNHSVSLSAVINQCLKKSVGR